MQESEQALQMLAHIGEDVFEFLVAAGAGKAHPLHTQIDGHPDSSSIKFAQLLPLAAARLLLPMTGPARCAFKPRPLSDPCRPLARRPDTVRQLTADRERD